MKKIKKETLQGWGILAGAAVVFIILKLTGATTWGWVWVLSPLWLPWAVVGLVAITMLPVLFVSFIKNVLKEDENGGT